MRTTLWGAAIGLLLARSPVAAHAQAFTRAQAIEAALARGPRSATVAADTLAAAAQWRSARAFPNPRLTTEYTKDTPQYHLLVDLPLDLGGLRAARVQAAAASREASQLRFTFDKASIRFDVDVAYTRAQAASARAAISRRNADAADSLRLIAAARRDAGDASDLEVELAAVNAGQQANASAGDAFEAASALLELGALVGRVSDEGPIALADSLGPSSEWASTSRPGTPILVDVATASLAASEAALRQQRRSTWLWPSLTAGFDFHDPGGTSGALPVVGIAIPLPLLDRNRGPILAATADRDRAAAALALARIEADAGRRRAERASELASARLVRDRTLLVSADRVAEMSLQAYREGALPLVAVLEAQRAARDVLLQYIDDVVAARIAAATLALVTLTAQQVL